jgi:hypothetical protein
MMRSSTFVVTLLAMTLSAPSIGAEDDDKRQIVTVSFGAGLNTAAAANHHIMPQQIRVRRGGVVNFVVAGFHQIFVYEPGNTPEDVREFIAANDPLNAAPFINRLNTPDNPDNLRYTGINPALAASPAGANPATPPAPVTRSNLGNRVESVAFPQRGTYLVICNVRGHFQDGMFAWVRVDDDDD